MIEKELRDASPWTLIIPRKQWEIVMYLSHLSAPNEIQMLAEITRLGRAFTMGKIHLVKQTVSGAHADFDEQDLAILVGSMENPELLRCWIHSHVNMGVFWSGTDQATIERLTNAGWVVSLVVTLDGRRKSRLDVGLAEAQEQAHEQPGMESLMMLPNRVTFNDIKIEINGLLSAEEKEGLKAQFEEKVEAFNVTRSFPMDMIERSKLLINEKRGSTMDLFKSRFAAPRYEEDMFADTETAGDAGIARAMQADERALPCETCAYDNPKEVCKKGIVRDIEWMEHSLEACPSWLKDEG